MISREEATGIAGQFLQQKPGQRFAVGKIYSWNEIPFRKPCLYDSERYDLENCYVAYLEDPDEEIMLKSSNIVVISKNTGEVLCFGSANDEG